MKNNFKGIFKGSKSSKKNIESNWKLIIGGLKEHKNDEFINKYGIIHIVRQIDGYFAFKPTRKLKKLLDEHNIECPEYFTSKERTRINKELKNNRINDSIQIEHLNGGVKRMFEIFRKKKWEGSTEENILEIVKLHSEHTICCYKLISEKEINDKTDIKKINF